MSVNYLSVENLTHHYGDVRLFDNLNFGISEGEKVGLIARNGTGKTTLLNILAQILPCDAGSVIYRKGITIGYLPQLPEVNDANTVIEEIFESENPQVIAIKAYEQALESGNHEELGHLIEELDKLGAWDFEARIKQILTQLKITKFDQLIGQLSGGQKKRVALAHILISEPDFLILDEPTNHLDLEMIEWLEDFMSRSKATLLMVTHDRYFLDRVCNEIYELADQTLYHYKGNYQYFLEKREERISTHNAQVEKAKNLLKTEQDWMNRMPQARGTKAKYRVDAFDDLKKRAHSGIQEQSINLDIKAARLGKKIIECFNVSKAFGDLKILDDFNYKFAQGEKVGIIGKNGTGKSTFLNTITGALEPDSGHLETGETVVVGYYRQDGMKIEDDKKVIDVISDISESITLGSGNSMSPAQFLRHFLFPNEMHYVQVEKLSGGEKKRLYLMTVLMKNPNFLILDEPTNDLDIFTLNLLEEYLQNFSGCVVIVSHDRYFMDKIVDHLFVFEGQGVIKDFPGNYSIYHDFKIEEEKEKRKVEKEKKEPVLREKPKDKPKKLSFKEKKEMEQLEVDMEELNTEKETIENELNSGSLSPEEIGDKAKRLNEIMEFLDEKEMRWLELSEIEG
ncbi:ABC-F family ATP-binding cassette domain-containing protein [Plebeiibacterium sediminum]|uniref:ABC-F family ATP-binding cassette domain-containing protein n=1 Tax=Plebeiibacterium sediminum TaxID=2992112 RepID=A0AAE3M5P7_9BACT|nr:ABC-F family ATP-binding cassette domain-containing protein [Plebeiobacterium sediminum]MCW3787609.1 ABC-F family ATP-binding cassette domain-containing protein [Plebeiobacterium sediminum]